MINYSPLSTTCGITVGGTGLSTITGQLYVGSTTDYFGSSTVIQLISGANNKNVGIRSNILYLYSYGNGSEAKLIFGDGSANFGLFSNDTEFSLYNYGTASNSITVNRSTNNATFAGGITAKTSTAGDYGLTLNTSNGDNMKLSVADTGTAGAANGKLSVSDGDFIVDVSGDITLDSSSAIFTGDVTAKDVTAGSLSTTASRTISILTAAEHNSVLKFRESTNNYGFTQQYNGTANYFELLRHDNSSGGNAIYRVPRNSDNITFFGNIILANTGRIQGIDTVSSGTDAANKTYVDNAVAGAPQGTVTKSGTPVNNQLAVWTSATNIEGEPELTYDGSTFTVGGSGNTTTYLNVVGTNTAGAPARAAAIRIYGYEGRGEGIFYYDSAYASSEWYSGIPYGGGDTWQIGHDTGGQAEYTANAILTFSTASLATFAGRVIADTHFQSSDTNATLSATGTGNVYLRPNGYSTTAGQVHINTSGNAAFAGNVSLITGKQLIFDGGTDATYISEDIADRLRFFVGGAEFMRFTEDTTDMVNFFKDVTVTGSTNVDAITASQFNVRDLGNYITFYGNDDANHSISSRDLSGAAADDLRFNSYGAMIFNLDSNDNNGTGADFVIGRHGGSGQISSTLFTLSGETGNATFTGTIETTKVRSDIMNNKADSANIIYRSGTNTIVGNHANALVIEDSGSIGIGTATPDADGYGYAEDLVIKGGASGADGAGITILGNGKRYGVIAFGDSADANAGEIFYDHTNNSMHFRTNGGSTLLNINSSGDVQTLGKLTVNGSSGINVDSTTHASISLDRASTSYDNNLIYRTAGTIKWRLWQDGSDDFLYIRDEANASNIVTFKTGGDTIFAGNVLIPSNLQHVNDDNNEISFTTDAQDFRTNNVSRLDISNSGVRFGGGNARVTTILDEDNMASNSATALATQQSIKAYVDNSISGGANYLGVWDPDDSLNNGYGNPSLQASTRTDDSGDYFICSADGAAHPNGGTTEPDSWHTGDWVVWNGDLGSSGLWQKIDNTTVLSGGGTANKIAIFTDSETIGDSRFSQNSTTNIITGPGNTGSNKSLSVTSAAGTEQLYIQGTGEVVVSQNYFYVSASQGAYINGILRARAGVTDDSSTLGLGGSGEVDNLVLTSNTSATFAGKLAVNGSSVFADAELDVLGDITLINRGWALRGNNSNTDLAIERVTGSSFNDNNIALTITGGQKYVGIGTTSPDSKLDVKGTSATPADGNQTLSITNSTGGTQLNLGTAENSYGWIEAREGSTLRNLLINPNGGNVGIGVTNPSSKLTIETNAGDGTIELLAANAATTKNKIIFSEAILGDESFFIEHDGAGAGADNLLKIHGDGSGGTASGVTIRRDGRVGMARIRLFIN